MKNELVGNYNFNGDFLNPKVLRISMLMKPAVRPWLINIKCVWTNTRITQTNIRDFISFHGHENYEKTDFKTFSLVRRAEVLPIARVKVAAFAIMYALEKWKQVQREAVRYSTCSKNASTLGWVSHWKICLGSNWFLYYITWLSMDHRDLVLNSSTSNYLHA